MKLSPHELADLVMKAGFSKTTVVPGTSDPEAVVAVAVAIAESNIDTETIARTTTSSSPESIGQRDHGIFQLSGRWQFDKIQGKGGRWRDPETNVAIAYKIFTGAGRTFTPWAVFKKDSAGVAPYEKYLNDARLGVSKPWPYVDDEKVALSTLTSRVDSLTQMVLELSAQVKQATDRTYKIVVD